MTSALRRLVCFFGDFEICFGMQFNPPLCAMLTKRLPYIIDPNGWNKIRIAPECLTTIHTINNRYHVWHYFPPKKTLQIPGVGLEPTRGLLPFEFSDTTSAFAALAVRGLDHVLSMTFVEGSCCMISTHFPSLGLVRRWLAFAGRSPS